MKVLIVTNQVACIRDSNVFVQENPYVIIKRFELLGEVSLLCQHFDHHSVNQVLDTIPPNKVTFIKKSRVYISYQDKSVIRSLVDLHDLIIGYVPCYNAEYALQYAQKSGKRTLAYVVACTWDALWNHSIGGKIYAPIAYLRLKEVISKSDYALYVTSEFLQKRYPCKGLTCGVSDVVIPNLDDKILQDRLCHIKTHDFKEISLCTVAGLNVRYKGQQYVIKAISQLKKRGDCRFHYYLYGEGDSSYLKGVCKKYKVEDQVHIVGRVLHKDIFEKLQKHDVYIQPSLQEGLPRSVVEAMSMGMLCIGAATGGIPELIDSRWITRRKSVSDIVENLYAINKDILTEQCISNYHKAIRFTAFELDKKRTEFFKIIKNDI